ncbi:MAG: phosphate butyryltransferase [Elusimicrobia bacterium]|nr:phosphate butyryltransferase [Elusimicrobiota bacterium]
MKFKNLDEMVSMVQGKPNRVVVPGADNDEVMEALAMGTEKGLISGGILIGDAAAVKASAVRAGLDLSSFELVPGTDQAAMCGLAVRCIKDDKADFLVKGLVETKNFLKAILNKELGMVPEGSTLSHLVLFETTRYHKPFFLTDAAILITPTLEEKRHMVQNAVDVARVTGLAKPKVSVVCPIEKVNPKVPCTVDAEELCRMSKDGRITDAVVEGPYDVYISFSRKLADEKGVKGGDVPGDVDIVVLPDLNTANVAYKTLTFFAEGLQSAALVAGARFPIVLPSRTDPPRTKMLSIALASFLQMHRQPT